MPFLLLRVAVVAAVFSWIRDLWIRARALDYGQDVATYALSLVGSFAFWLLLVCALVRLRKTYPRRGRALTWGFGIIAWYWTVLFFGYIDVMSYDPPSSALSLKGSYVFDPIADPNEQTNLLSQVSAEERARFAKDARERPRLRPLLERLSPELAKN